MYIVGNPKSKKAVKDLIAAGKKLRVFAPGLGTPPENGTCAVEGPHFPEAHRWYGIVTIKDGIVVSIK